MEAPPRTSTGRAACGRFAGVSRAQLCFVVLNCNGVRASDAINTAPPPRDHRASGAAQAEPAARRIMNLILQGIAVLRQYEPGRWGSAGNEHAAPPGGWYDLESGTRGRVSGIGRSVWHCESKTTP